MFINLFIIFIFMQIIVFIVIGLIAGWVASIIMKTDGSQSMVGDIIVGILGALIGLSLIHI